MPNTKHVTVDQAQSLMTAVTTKSDARFVKIADNASYTIKQQAEPETGYASTYQLFSVVGSGASAVETAVGAKINIAKDQFVQSGTVETVTTQDVPYQGATPGDLYVDLILANATSQHIYIPVNDLVDVYTAGNGISVSGNAISVVVDSSSSNGLSVGASGLALAVATTSAAGAMSPTDKTKLDGFETASDSEIQAIIDGMWAS